MASFSFFPVNKIRKSRIPDINFHDLGFGNEPTDHMFIAEYRNGSWQNPRIEAFRDIQLSPFAKGLHYGQTVFEGLKAYHMQDNSISVFRPEKHHKRFNHSLKRMCMPEIPYELFITAIKEFVSLEKNWIPVLLDSSLYIRPFMIATESKIGAGISNEYLFILIASPCGPFYTKPLHVKVETEFTRAAPGGVGWVKCGGNYAAALYPTALAHEEGFDQLLWTDAAHREYIEESGAMNLIFFIGDTLITPPLGTRTILDGVTRDSILTLARDNNIVVEERKVSIGELVNAFEQKIKVEAFGTGTAATIAPIRSIHIEGTSYGCYIGKDAKMYFLKNRLMLINTGVIVDTHNWNFIISV